MKSKVRGTCRCRPQNWRTAARLVGLAGLALCTPGARAGTVHTFQHERVLGTALQLMVAAPSEAAAKAVEKHVLAEVGRLDAILGTYRADSEISRLATATTPAKCSAELLDVLEACRAWQDRSGGAFNPQLGEVIALWRQAEREGKLPDADRLAAAVAKAQEPACRTDRASGTVTWAGGAKLNVDALAKGYIVDRALAAAAAKTPEAQAILLSIGGDIRVWNRNPQAPAKEWQVCVADPANSADNAPGISNITLVNGAVATSGSHARYRRIGETRYSHVLDGRTGQPVTEIVSATVIAPNCATADALATICMVLPMAEGLRLVQSVEGAECLLVGVDGARSGTGPWQNVVGAVPSANPPATASVWPAGYRLTVSLTLAQTRERPMGAFWIEDAQGRCVKTLTVWAQKSKYLDKLPKWYAHGGKELEAVRAVTRGTPDPGTHSVVWDGTDAAGRPVASGPYKVRIELHDRKNLLNQYLDFGTEVLCGPKPAEASLPDRGFATGIRILYGLVQ